MRPDWSTNGSSLTARTQPGGTCTPSSAADDEIVFSVDGAPVERVTRPMVDFFGSWEFDDDKFLILNVALGGTYPFKTNGIRTPYYGLAAETVDAISQDRAVGARRLGQSDGRTGDAVSFLVGALPHALARPYHYPVHLRPECPAAAWLRHRSQRVARAKFDEDVHPESQRDHA